MYKLSYQQQAYKRINVETANPGRVLITLYDALIKFTRQGIEQIERRDIGGKGISLGRAYAIIAEFIHALDYEKAPELCNNLEMIYNFWLEQIADANNAIDAERLKPILSQIENMRQTWSEAVTKTTIESASAAGGQR